VQKLCHVNVKIPTTMDSRELEKDVVIDFSYGKMSVIHG